MSTWLWIVIGVAVLVAVAALAFVAWRRMRTQRLRETFGPEYERVAADAPTTREAESRLRERERRRESLEIRPLSAESRERYGGEWNDVQARFVDDPVGAVRDADRLVERVMSERGYPMDDFESQADLVSVDHPEVVQNYRSAHRIALSYDRGESSTEDLRQAMVHYRSLFEELLESGEPAREAR